MKTGKNAKKIVFVTGTRADYGKLKPLIISSLKQNFNIKIFICGMHLDVAHGSTYLAVMRDFPNICQLFNNLTRGNDASNALSECIYGFNKYLLAHNPDLVVVHGDRVEAMGACMGACLNNIYVAHIEGGEQSGTIDESIRHAISKFSHHHFVCNEQAKSILIKLGERSEYIYNIGSSDIDYIANKQYPSFGNACAKYDILFDQYGVVLYHPITTNLTTTVSDCYAMVNALKKTNRNYVVVLPNNDMGSQQILEIYNSNFKSMKFRILPSMDFEYFISILSHSSCLIGNSSAGVREMPYLDLPSVNIGRRQQSRLNIEVDSIINLAEPTAHNIFTSIEKCWGEKFENKFNSFGNGNSSTAFQKVLTTERFWEAPIQKQLCY